MLQELINLNLFAFFLIFARVGTALSLLPGFASSYVNQRARLSFALAISLVLTPVLAQQLPTLPGSPSVLVLLITKEILVGGFFGMMGRVLMGALQTAGTLIAYTSAMANAFIQDALAEQQSSIIANFLGITAITVIFVTDGHHLMLAGLVDSYTLFAAGATPPAGDISETFAKMVSEAFTTGVKLASPAIIAGLSYYLVLGLLNRLMPQLPIFFVGMPVQLAVQISLFAIVFSSIIMAFMTYFEDSMLRFIAG